MQYIEFGKDKDKVKIMQVVTNMFSKMDSNDLGALKKYLDSGKSKIHDYTKAIEYYLLTCDAAVVSTGR